MNKEVVLYWSRAPGNFVSKYTGEEVFKGSLAGLGPNFQGTVREWYETLIETITDAAMNCSGRNVIVKEGQTIEELTEEFSKKMSGLTGKVTVNRDVLTILEHTIPFKTNLPHWGLGIPLQEGLVGSLNNRFEVYLNDSQPFDQILVEVEGNVATVIVKDLCVL